MRVTDWEHEPVPKEHRQPFYKVAAVWINFVFVPVFINFAFQLGSRLSFNRLLASFLVGGFILALCSAATGVVGQRTGLTAGLLVKHVFGTSGGKLMAVLGPICLIGWDSFSLDLIGSETTALLGIQELRWAIIVCVMLLFTSTAVVGFRWLATMSLVTIPLMVGLLTYALLRSAEVANTYVVPPLSNQEDFGKAVTKVVGLFALGSTLASPDIQRFCKSSRSAISVGLVTFIGALPFLLIVGGLAALRMGTETMMATFGALGVLGLGYLALFLLSWSSCDNDYYSAALGLAAVSGLKKAQLVIPVGCVAAFIAIVGVAKYLEPWLLVMTTLSIPISGVFVAEALNGSLRTGLTIHAEERWRSQSFVSWVLGAAISFLSIQYSFGIPPIQGFVVALVTQALLNHMLRKSSSTLGTPQRIR